MDKANHFEILFVAATKDVRLRSSGRASRSVIISQVEFVSIELIHGRLFAIHPPNRIRARN
jgi:hypothetical protein